MNIFPAIDLVQGKAVRLFKGDYAQMTVYSECPPEIAADFGREVVRFKWNGVFPKKRNWVLRNYKFNTPWVMFLDADERMTPDFLAELERTLPTTKCNAFVCYYDNWFMGRILRHGDVMRKTSILRLGTGEYEKIDEHSWSNLDM